MVVSTIDRCMNKHTLFFAGAIPIINEFSPDDATIATYIRYPNCTGEEIRLQDCINDQEQTCSQNQIVSVSCEG